MAVHTIGDLKQMQSLPLEAKIIMTKNRIRLFYDKHDSYISFSGGKDSTVLLDIARDIFPDMPAVFSDTGLEYPELREFVKTIPNVIWVHPIKYDRSKKEYVRTNFREVIKEYGYPIISKDVANCVQGARHGSSTRMSRLEGNLIGGNGKLSIYNCPKWKYLLDAPFKVSDNCCRIMKKNPMLVFQKKHNLAPITAMMACESLKRKNAWFRTGCNIFDEKHPQSNPMAFWTEQDVLQYLKEKKIPYTSIYGDIIEDENGKLKTTGCKRTGCIFCGFGCHLEKEPNRFQRLKITHPQLHEYCMKSWSDGGLGMREVLNYIGVRSE